MSYINSLGNPTRNTFLAIEPNKLSQEFTVGGTALKRGQPVKLSTTGTVVPWAAADGIGNLIGYCYSDAAIASLVTIFTRGFMLIYALSTDILFAGRVKYVGYSTTTTASDGPSELIGTAGYNTYGPIATIIDSGAPSTDDQANGWALDPANGPGDIIRVLLKN